MTGFAGFTAGFGEYLHHADWAVTIFRQISPLESIYDKISNEQAARRTEFLEVIIILLITLEIVLSFMPGLRP